MKLGKVHLVGSLAMTALASVYTVWSFSPSSSGRSTAAAAPPLLGTPVPGDPSVATTDPMQIPPVADVVLDRLPEWPRDPFAPTRRPAVAPVVETVDEPDAPPRLVVASILYSSSRKVAVVNGRRVRVGDTIGGETLVEILPNAVVLESPLHGRRTIERRSASRGGR